MIAKIKLTSGAIYTLSVNGWEGTDKDIAKSLNAAFPFPSRSAAYDPNPIVTVANTAAAALKATVIETPSINRDKPGVFY